MSMVWYLGLMWGNSRDTALLTVTGHACTIAAMTQRIDVCNGDADGLCAAVQWRLHEPRSATLITGLKRDIQLLKQVQAQAGDQLNVFDVSMQRNQQVLKQLLDAGVQVRYVDHHEAGAIPVTPLLSAHIDQATDTCTSLIVDQLLQGAWRRWALVGAYGDNLTAVADQLAVRSGLSPAQSTTLRELGEAINYNAYGEVETDVCITPARLFELMRRYADPLDFMAQEPIAADMQAHRDADLQQAMNTPAHSQSEHGAVYLLPNAPWSRRVSGTFANELANTSPDRAHAVLTLQEGGSYIVSVRAPLTRPSGAAALCQRFGGSGRARAAGLDALPEPDLPRFIDAFSHHNWGV